MKKHNLSRYVASVIVVWAVILISAWLIGGGTRFKDFTLVCGGFAIGMVSMYIATRFYKS